MRLTKTGQRLMDAMKAALDSGTWERVPTHGLCIRYTEEGLAMPQHMRDWPGGAYKHWETYDRHQFLTFLGSAPIIWGLAATPWVERRDSSVPYRDAFEILVSPEKYWSASPTVLRRISVKEGGVD